LPELLMMNKLPFPQAPRAHIAQAGFTLIELMVSVVVGMVIVASLALLFANNSRARQEMEKTSQQIENGRYTTQTLRDDLRLAGYYGELSPKSLAAPAAVPDPSATDDASVSAALPIAVQGYHFGKDSASYSTMPTGVSSLLTDIRSNTDVLVVRRTSTCYSGPTTAESNCSSMDTSSSKYFQTTLCSTHLTNITDPTKLFVVGTDTAVFTTSNPSVSTYTPTFFAQKDCSTAAVTRAFNLHIYYIANNDVSGDGIPTLKMVSLGAASFSSPVALAEGIETLQIEYGVDTTGDGSPDTWAADPSAGTANAAAAVAAWGQVTAVKLHVLARNTQSSSGQFIDTRSYVLGSTTSADNTYGPYNDAYKRHVYTTVVRMVNVAGRLE
jgi:type IV pilus assembly protein PilW